MGVEGQGKVGTEWRGKVGPDVRGLRKKEMISRESRTLEEKSEGK